MLHFNCLGIPVRVEPFFWITMAILGALNTSGMRGGNSPNDVLLIALFVLAGFLSIMVHEMGHALTARRFGGKSDIILHGFGGLARHHGTRLTRMRSIAITAAGPIYQLVLGVLVIIFVRATPPLSAPGESFLIYLIVISVFWALFNLLPILPMDGGQILQAALGPGRTRITLLISLATCIILTILGILIRQPFIALFMGYFGYQSWKSMQQVG
ncbi:MAG: metalloprotease [Luteolibacter sp.]